MTQQAGVERVLQWFAEQPAIVRDAILRRTGDPAGELVKLKMAEITSGSGDSQIEPVTMDRAISVMRLMLDRVEQINVARVREIKSSIANAKKRG